MQRYESLRFLLFFVLSLPLFLVELGFYPKKSPLIFFRKHFPLPSFLENKGGRRLFFTVKFENSRFHFSKKSHFWRSKSSLCWVKWLECVYWRMIGGEQFFFFQKKGGEDFFPTKKRGPKTCFQKNEILNFQILQ